MVAAVHDPGSIGVRTYVERLSAALAEQGIDYRPVSRPDDRGICHFHLANSTRSVVAQAALQRRRYLLTIHDVLPRCAVLRPLQRAVIVPLCARRAATVVVHSHHAASLLDRQVGLAAVRVEVIPHPAPVPRSDDREAARCALGLGGDSRPLFVLPGTLKSAKLVTETLSAAGALIATGRLRLLLAGHLDDDGLGSAAAALGAQVLCDPDATSYERAIVAADAVLCLRTESVGESNGPLLDAIGAGRPSLVTGVGSAPEVAGDSARVVAPTVPGIRVGIEALLDADERSWRADAARARAAELTWAAAAQRHRELFAEVEHG